MKATLLWLLGLTSIALFAECSVPEDLSNYLNEYVCSTDVRLVRPLSVADVEEAVKRHARVRAVGTGYSWNKFYCAPSPSETEDPSDTSANIVVTTIRPLKIQVNGKDRSVWVSAGVSVWDLVAYLANYVTPAAPRGYSLLAASNFVNQTVAGAIATGTHGSSLRHGSISNQVIAVRVVLANGTSVEISEESHPFLMKAFRINVGRLGIVTDVKLRIVPETLIRRIFRVGVPSDEVMSMLKRAQEMYKATGVLPQELEGLGMAWQPRISTFNVYVPEPMEESHNLTESECSFEECYMPTEESKAFLEDLIQTKINSPVNDSHSTSFSDIPDGVSWQEPSPLPPILSLGEPNAAPLDDPSSADGFPPDWNNSVVETHEAFIFTTSSLVEIIKRLPQDDYSLAVSADKMADCFEEIVSISETRTSDNGFRRAATVRFVGIEDALLSASHVHPHMRLDISDLVYYNQRNRSTNVPFKELIGFIVTSPMCAPVRLHWGKSGWPDSGCWNGVEFYKDTWCDFGCAVQELDPLGKFVGGDPNIWNWNGANLEKCCTADGYDTSLEGCGCEVIPVRTLDECPEPPFYTNR